MELRNPVEETEIWGEYVNSNMTGDEEEALSLCDLPLHNENSERESTLRDSNTGCSEHEQDFNFDLSHSSTMAFQACPADDLFRQGRLLPLGLQRCRSESNAQISYGQSNCWSENRRMWNEKMQAWRIESMDSHLQPSYCTSGMSGNSEGSQRKFYSSGKSAPPFSRSKSKPDHMFTKLPPSGPKISPKWQQFFTLGLVRPPPMKLEDLRLKHRKSCNNGVENLILKRSASCNYDESSKQVGETEHRGVIFQQKSISIKENKAVEEKHRSKGWRMLLPLPSSNGCKPSIDAVVNCTSSVRKMAS